MAPRFVSRRSTVSTRAATISLSAASSGAIPFAWYDSGGYFG
jgi:hypothetical protein